MITNDVLIDIAEEVSDLSSIKKLLNKYDWLEVLVGSSMKDLFYLIFSGNMLREDTDMVEGQFYNDIYYTPDSFMMRKIKPVVEDMRSAVYENLSSIENIIRSYIGDIYPDCEVEFQRNAWSSSPSGSMYDDHYDVGMSLSFGVYDLEGNAILFDRLKPTYL